MNESVSLGQSAARQLTPREVVDRELRRVGRDRAKLEYETCALLLEGERVGVHRGYGYASIREYAEAVVGLSPRETEERLRVARALESLPEIAAKLRAAEMSFTAVRELSRVATPQTEGEWLEAAGSKSVRQIERLVSGHVLGDRPSDPPTEEARRHRVVLDLSAHDHLDERAEGGKHDPNRLIPLCGAHHDAAHRHVLLVRGDAITGFVFEHADGRAYGSTEVRPQQAQALANIEGMLRSLGYKAGEARAMVDAIRGRFPPGVSDEELLRAALCEAPSVSRACRVSESIPAYGSPSPSLH